MATKSKSSFGNWFSNSSSKNEAEKQHDKKVDEMREEKKQEGDESPDEKRKVVMHGAKIQCNYMPAPGTLLVTSNMIKLQGKLWATEADSGKLNLQFNGACMHSKFTYNKPPCLSVITPLKWEDVGTTLVQGKKVLLKNSTIKCAISNEKIKIIFDGQTCTPATLSSTETDAVTESNFNAVIQFYRSVEQSEGKAGMNDTTYSGGFGYDKFDKNVIAEGLIEKYHALGSVIQKKENISGHKQYLCSYLSIWPPAVDGNTDGSKSFAKIFVKAEQSGNPPLSTDKNKDEVEFSSSDPNICFTGGASSLKKILTLNSAPETIIIECKGKISDNVTITAKAQGSIIGQLIVVPNNKCYKTLIQPVRLKFSNIASTAVTKEPNIPFLTNLISGFNQKSFNQAGISAELAQKTDVITLNRNQFSKYLSNSADGNVYLTKNSESDSTTGEYNDLIESRYAALLSNQQQQNKTEEKVREKIKGLIETFDKHYKFTTNDVKKTKKGYANKIVTEAWNHPKVKKALSEYEAAMNEYRNVGKGAQLEKKGKIHLIITDDIYGAGTSERRVPAYSLTGSGVTHLFSSALTDSDAVGVALHELGHALGLKHTFDKSLGDYTVPVEGVDFREDLEVRIDKLKKELEALKESQNIPADDPVKMLGKKYATIEKSTKSLSWFMDNFDGVQTFFINPINEIIVLESMPMTSGSQSPAPANNPNRSNEITTEINALNAKLTTSPKKKLLSKSKPQSDTQENYMDYNQDTQGNIKSNFQRKTFYQWQWDEMRTTGEKQSYLTS